MEIAISTALDLLIVLIFVISIVIGMRRGLVKSVIGLFGKVVALIVAFLLSANLGTYIDTNYVHAPMRQWLVDRLSPTAEGVKASLEDLDLEELLADQPQFFLDTLEFLNIDVDAVIEKYNSLKESGVEYAKSAVTDTMITPISATVSRVIAFVLIFLICCIAIAVLWWLSDLVINIPVVRQLDKFGGAVAGIISAFLVTFIAVSLVNVASGYVIKDTSIADRQKIIDNTVVYEYFDDINPFNRLFGKW